MTAHKPVLILQLRPEDETSDSEFAAILKYGELDIAQTQRIRLEQNGMPHLSLDDYSAIIVGGSPFDISTAVADKSEIQRTIESDFNRLFDQVVPADFPFLGACSGCGLLGSYLGSNISNQYAEKVGVVSVELTEQGRQDPLLEDFPDSLKVLLGHKEACDDLPKGSTLLIQGQACPVQMFRVGKNVYATQFHPEGDAEGFQVRVDAYQHHGYFPAETATDLMTEIRAEDTPFARTILRRFVMRFVQP